MKLIHCADLHLDAKMTSNLDKEKAKERKGELLHTFERMVAYAAQNDISAILIAGDMFDTKNISATTRNTVLAQIASHPDITFFYLKGNHDNDNFLSGLEQIPHNLKMFGSEWNTYKMGGVNISGIELSKENSGAAYTSLVLENDKFNIVILHGQEAESVARDKAEVINLKALRNRGIDYLALGHVHAYKREQLDGRGIYCYPGCLEGRGFDECGEHGFVVLHIDDEKKTFTDVFIPFAERKLYTVEVDVSGVLSSTEMAARISKELKENNYSRENLLKIILTGMLDVECEKNVDYLVSKFKNDFYFLKIYDETSLRVNMEDYMLDESLKGEFVRMVMKSEDVSEEDKKIIIRYGLQAIAGEELQ